MTGAAALFLVLVAGLSCSAKVDAAENRSEGASDSNSVGARQPGEYRLAPGDRLSIVVFEQSELSGDFLLDGAGQILLPLAGLVRVGGLTLVEAQQLIQQRFAEGVLVKPSVSARIAEYRPIFIIGDVRNPGSYPFRFGQSVKATIAAAGGQGRANQLLNTAMADFILADERVRLLESNQRGLFVRKARLESQRDGASEFTMPQLAGLDARNIEVSRIYAAENDSFNRRRDTYRKQIQVLQQQRPRLEAEMEAVTAQIAKERRRLSLAHAWVTRLEEAKRQGLGQSSVLNEQQRDEARIESEVARLEARIERLKQDMGDIEVRIEDVNANYNGRILTELHETQERLREIEVTLGTARELRDVRAQEAGGIEGVEPSYVIFITRTHQRGATTFNATKDTVLEPGDVIEVKRERNSPDRVLPSPYETTRSEKRASSR